MLQYGLAKILLKDYKKYSEEWSRWSKALSRADAKYRWKGDFLCYRCGSYGDYITTITKWRQVKRGHDYCDLYDGTETVPICSSCCDCVFFHGLSKTEKEDANIMYKKILELESNLHNEKQEEAKVIEDVFKYMGSLKQ